MEKLKHISKPKRVNKVYDVIAIGTGFVVCLFHILSITIPDWWVLEEIEPQVGHVKYHFGIWFTRTCFSTGCETEKARMTGDRAWLIGPAVLTVIAGVLMVCVVILITLSLVKDWGAPLRKLCVLGSGGAGGIVALAIVIFVKKKAGLRPSIAPETSDGEPGWTLAISIVAAILALMNAVIIGVGVAKHYKGERPPVSQLNMEIHVTGTKPNAKISSDLATKREIEKKKKPQRRSSGIVYYNDKSERL